MELNPISKDSLQGPAPAFTLALVYAWKGERDLPSRRIYALTTTAPRLFLGASAVALGSTLTLDNGMSLYVSPSCLRISASVCAAE